MTQVPALHPPGDLILKLNIIEGSNYSQPSYLKNLSSFRRSELDIFYLRIKSVLIIIAWDEGVVEGADRKYVMITTDVK